MILLDFAFELRLTRMLHCIIYFLLLLNLQTRTMETATKALKDELSRIAKDVVNASNRLQKEFTEAPDIQTADE
jgi:hypothetical protein